jgi:hypothetical protein
MEPGDHRIYRLRGSFFRVRADELAANAELYKDGGWVDTAIPSGSIIAHELTEEITSEEAQRLGVVG